jgi:hypothetical protein
MNVCSLAQNAATCTGLGVPPSARTVIFTAMVEAKTVANTSAVPDFLNLRITNLLR